MISEGLIITAIGMGTVLMFLIVLVCSINLTAKVLTFVNKFLPEEVAEPVKVASNSSSNDENIAVAIAVARMNMK